MGSSNLCDPAKHAQMDSLSKKWACFSQKPSKKNRNNKSDTEIFFRNKQAEYNSKTDKSLLDMLSKRPPAAKKWMGSCGGCNKKP